MQSRTQEGSMGVGGRKGRGVFVGADSVGQRLKTCDRVYPFSWPVRIEDKKVGKKEVKIRDRASIANPSLHQHITGQLSTLPLSTLSLCTSHALSVYTNGHTHTQHIHTQHIHKYMNTWKHTNTYYADRLTWTKKKFKGSHHRVCACSRGFRPWPLKSALRQCQLLIALYRWIQLYWESRLWALPE